MNRRLEVGGGVTGGSEGVASMDVEEEEGSEDGSIRIVVVVVVVVTVVVVVVTVVGVIASKAFRMQGCTTGCTLQTAKASKAVNLQTCFNWKQRMKYSLLSLLECDGGRKHRVNREK